MRSGNNSASEYTGPVDFMYQGVICPPHPPPRPIFSYLVGSLKCPHLPIKCFACLSKLTYELKKFHDEILKIEASLPVETD